MNRRTAEPQNRRTAEPQNRRTAEHGTTAQKQGKGKMSSGFDIEERLIDFAVQVIKTSEKLPKSVVGCHIASQLVRCGTSPAANYGEAQSAESRADFIHKRKSA